jgi:hypothetical protein
VVEGLGATHALQEQDYIDADYGDEFANFYASTFPEGRENAVRALISPGPMGSRPCCGS